jgi:hypothetical protein
MQSLPDMSGKNKVHGYPQQKVKLTAHAKRNTSTGLLNDNKKAEIGSGGRYNHE